MVDTLTAHIIRRLDVADAIERVCGKIGVTRTTIDLFRQKEVEAEQFGLGQSGQLGWHLEKWCSVKARRKIVRTTRNCWRPILRG